MMLFLNWKMYLREKEALDLAKYLAAFKAPKALTIAAFPSAEQFAPAHEIAPKIVVGVQDVGPTDFGAATGEISPVEARRLGARYALIGHSERRHTFGESDEIVAKKFAAALAAGLTPVLCVGETLEERKAEKTIAVVRRQLISCLSSTSSKLKATSFLIAYEPVWAIGTGTPATPDQVAEMHIFVKKELRTLLGDVKGVKILYGGSVSAENIAELADLPAVDGALVGSASAKKKSLAALLEAALDVVQG